MRDGDEMDLELLVDLLRDFSNFAQRHGLVRLVLEIERTPVMGMIANTAVEGNDGPIFGRAYMPDQSGLIDRVAHENKKIGLN
jgi:hypothetical protein